jgi:reversibly glycosylated polypeptide/UDP-arabinopyranose mutase
MPFSDTALVVPSIREESLARFLREWQPTGLFDRVDLIVMEDNPEKTFKVEVDFCAGGITHLCWEDIDRHGWAHIIPRRSDTVRSYAYWHAWKQGYQYLMTLDDDCYPNPDYPQPDLVHKQMLNERTRWFNTLNSVRPRGVPYFNLGKMQGFVNHGIWTGVLDYDAPQQLVDPVPEIYTHDNRIVPLGAYHPFCGMNVMWRREAMVLSYHLLMGRRFKGIDAGGCGPECPDFDATSAIESLPFDRFGDIWCGIIQKKICDHLGWPVSTGTPYIHHDRASNPFTNLRKEANGIEVNEWFWEKIHGIMLYEGYDASQCYTSIGVHIREFGGEHANYWSSLGDAMITWAGLFTEK